MPESSISLAICKTTITYTWKTEISNVSNITVWDNATKARNIPKLCHVSPDISARKIRKPHVTEYLQTPHLNTMERW